MAKGMILIDSECRRKINKRIGNPKWRGKKDDVASLRSQ
jgi:hypothetical protein